MRAIAVYANDCNAFKLFSLNMSNTDVFDLLLNCQTSLHAWEHANRVVFDAGKEETMIISMVDAAGGPIKLLDI